MGPVRKEGCPMNSGKPKSSRSSRKTLGSRDRRILDDAIRFRLLTNEAIHRLHLPSVQPNAITKVTARLVKQEWLVAHQFAAKTQYFVPGTKAIRSFGLPASRSRVLGPQALATYLAIIEYAMSASDHLRILTDSELSHLLNDESKGYRSLMHAVEQVPVDGLIRVIRVDLGGSPSHIAQKLNSDIQKRISHLWYASLLAHRKLIFVVLTPSPSKKTAIETAIRKRVWPNGIRFSVHVTPILCTLVGI